MNTQDEVFVHGESNNSEASVVPNGTVDWAEL